MRPVLIGALVSAALVAVYLAAGGASYGPDPVADPCEPREWREPGPLDELAQQLAISGMDGAACELGVTREELARALATDESLDAFTAAHEIDDRELDAAVRAGLERVIDDAEAAGEIPSLAAPVLRSALTLIPAGRAFDLLLDARPLLEGGVGLLDGSSGFGLGDILDGIRGR